MADDIYKNLREFRSPRDYVWQECCVRFGKIYQVTNLNGTGNRWIEEDWREIAITDIDFTTIDNSIEVLTLLISSNTKQIEDLNRLLAQLIFELINQGIKIQSEELLNELKTYLCK